MYCAITTLVPSLQLSLDAVALSVGPESSLKRESVRCRDVLRLANFVGLTVVQGVLRYEGRLVAWPGLQWV